MPRDNGGYTQKEIIEKIYSMQLENTKANAELKSSIKTIQDTLGEMKEDNKKRDEKINKLLSEKQVDENQSEKIDQNEKQIENLKNDVETLKNRPAVEAFEDSKYLKKNAKNAVISAIIGAVIGAIMGYLGGKF